MECAHYGSICPPRPDVQTRGDRIYRMNKMDEKKEAGSLSETSALLAHDCASLTAYTFYTVKKSISSAGGTLTSPWILGPLRWV